MKEVTGAVNDKKLILHFDVDVLKLPNDNNKHLFVKTILVRYTSYVQIGYGENCKGTTKIILVKSRNGNPSTSI
jgi:hypothetical protein